jgi:hypothetical protein
LAKQKGWVASASLVADVDSGKKTRVLVPTWTPSGEMYYVKATWNPKDARVQNCLRDLFHLELDDGLSRTVAQEDQLMCDKRMGFGMCTGTSNGRCKLRIRSLPVGARLRSSTQGSKETSPFVIFLSAESMKSMRSIRTSCVIRPTNAV